MAKEKIICDTDVMIVTAIEIGNAHKILDTVTEEAPELFFQLDELNQKESKAEKQKGEITLGSIKEIVKWDRKNKRLKDLNINSWLTWQKAKRHFQTEMNSLLI